MSEEQNDMELFEFEGPSGDKYTFRDLTYGEKMDISEKRARGMKVKGDTRKMKNKKDIPDAEIDIDVSVITSVQRDAVWKTIVKAPWLKEGVKSTKELVDNNVKGKDAEAMNEFVENINWPKGDVVEKSNGP